MVCHTEESDTADHLALTLVHESESLKLRASRRNNPITGRPEAQVYASEGIAFDHAQMIGRCVALF